MNQLWGALIVLSVVATSVFLILLILELRKTARSLSEFLERTEESFKPTLEELQQTLRSLRNVSDNLSDATNDIKTFSMAVRDVGQHVRHISNTIEDVTSSTAIKASGLKVGIRTALGVLLSNLFLKKGGGR